VSVTQRAPSMTSVRLTVASVVVARTTQDETATSALMATTTTQTAHVCQLQAVQYQFIVTNGYKTCLFPLDHVLLSIDLKNQQQQSIKLKGQKIITFYFEFIWGGSSI